MQADIHHATTVAIGAFLLSTAALGAWAPAPTLDTAEDPRTPSRALQAERNRKLAATFDGPVTRDAVAVAELAADWQASTLGDEPVRHPTSSPASPAAALRSLSRTTDVASPAGAGEDLDGLEDLPTPTRRALADLLGAYLAYEQAARSAMESDGGPRDDVRPLLASRVDLLREARALDQVPLGGPDATLDVPPLIRLDLRITCPDETYDEDYLLQVDACGSDTYDNNAGGSGIDLPDPPGSPTPIDPCLPGVSLPEIGAESFVGYGLAAASIDLSGDDVYGNATEPRSCGVNGGGYLGAGFLYDAAGNDTYEGWNHAVNGGGRQGSGFLLDQAGHDTYRSGASGVNGGGFAAGSGTLIDMDGDDSYQAAREHTTYGYGANGAASGLGVSLATGFLYDATGDDDYAGGQEGVNGAGYVTGVGFLFDGAGDDTYRATYIAVNGEGYLGVGTLYDASGHDWYETTGIFSDRNGWDVTIVPKSETLLVTGTYYGAGAQIDAGG